MLMQIVKIFDRTSFKEGILRYFELGRKLRLVPIRGEIVENDALSALNRLYVMEHVYRKDVLQVIDLFHKHSIQESRTPQLYSYLGEMLGCPKDSTTEMQRVCEETYFSAQSESGIAPSLR